MPVTFDAVSHGSLIAGPDTDTLTSGWTHTPVGAPGVVLVGFKYKTTVPTARSVGRTVTVGGHDLTQMKPPMGQVGMGWGAPKPGFIEVWAGIGAAAAGGAVAIDLGYDPITGNPLSPADATFSDFSAVALTYLGCTTMPDPAVHKGVSGRSASGRLISVPVSNFMNALGVTFVGADSAISEDAPHATTRYLASDSGLWVGDHQGPGTIRMETPGGNWGAVTVNLMPT
jgi:hypothetical protein